MLDHNNKYKNWNKVRILRFLGIFLRGKWKLISNNMQKNSLQVNSCFSCKYDSYILIK